MATHPSHHRGNFVTVDLERVIYYLYGHIVDGLTRSNDAVLPGIKVSGEDVQFPPPTRIFGPATSCENLYKAAVDGVDKGDMCVVQLTIGSRCTPLIVREVHGRVGYLWEYTVTFEETSDVVVPAVSVARHVETKNETSKLEIATLFV